MKPHNSFPSLLTRYHSKQMKMSVSKHGFQELMYTHGWKGVVLVLGDSFPLTLLKMTVLENELYDKNVTFKENQQKKMLKTLKTQLKIHKLHLNLLARNLLGIT